MREAEAGPEGNLGANDAAAAVEVVLLLVHVHAAAHALCRTLQPPQQLCKYDKSSKIGECFQSFNMQAKRCQPETSYAQASERQNTYSLVLTLVKKTKIAEMPTCHHLIDRASAPQVRAVVPVGCNDGVLEC